MILEISFNGYRFFKNSTISFNADSRTQKLLSNSICLKNKMVLKSVGIYGSNNSGKSNIFELFNIIKLALLGSENLNCNSRLFNDNRTSTFSIIYNNNDDLGWLKYEFTYDNVSKLYIKEELSTITYYENGAPFTKNIFLKDIKKGVFTVLDKKYYDLIKIIPSTKPILYSIRTDGDFFNLNTYVKSFNSTANSLVLIQMFNIPILNTINALKDIDKKKKKFIVNFVKNADIAIDDFKYSKDIKVTTDKEINEIALQTFKDFPDALHLTTKYGKTEVASLFYDSSGTKKIQAIASYIYDAVINGHTLIVDELDNGLHYKLTRAIVSAFNNLSNNKGQLLFTAHDLLLIDCKNLMRKDQIYFLERTKECGKLFCLKELPVSKGGPRESSNLLKRYNRGDFINVPSPSFINGLLDIKEKEENAKRNKI